MPDRDGQPINTSGIATDRRRPGRRDVNPVLIPLLRRPAGDGVLRDIDDDIQFETIAALRPGQDPLDAARGVAMSLVLSVSLWGVVGALGMAL